jgi:peptidyl-prolyl cis-trans isomerase C
MAAQAAIRVNGVLLPPHVIAAEAQHHPARTPRAAARSAARALVVRMLLLEEAARKKVSVTPEWASEGKRETEDEARIRALLNLCVPIREPNEQECRAYYDSDPARFSSPDLFEASHILFAAAPEDREAQAKAEAQARAAIAEILLRPERFEAIARESSDCSSGESGGRLGQLIPGETVPEFEAVLATLAVGAIAGEPVSTRFGVHVVRLDARISGRALPFHYARPRIEMFLAERQWRLDVIGLIDGLVANAVIEGMDMTPHAEALQP